MNIIEEIIYPVLDQIKDEEDLDFENSKDLALYGGQEGAIFDSLAIVDFLVEIKDKISEVIGKDVVVATQKALSSEESPFRTVATLEKYIESLITDK